jgi:hypothetical protein
LSPLWASLGADGQILPKVRSKVQGAGPIGDKRVHQTSAEEQCSSRSKKEKEKEKGKEKVSVVEFACDPTKSSGRGGSELCFVFR